MESHEAQRQRLSLEEFSEPVPAAAVALDEGYYRDLHTIATAYMVTDCDHLEGELLADGWRCTGCGQRFDWDGSPVS